MRRFTKNIVKKYFKKYPLSFWPLPIFFMAFPAWSIDLIGVYQQAENSAPLFKSYQATRDSADQGYYAAVGGLFPTVALSAAGGASAYNSPGYNGAYLEDTASVTLTQPIFNINLWGTTLNQADTASAAHATYEYNLERFMLEVATDYFNVLSDKDTLTSDIAAVKFYKETFRQTQEKFDVGLSTIKDVKQAEANYDLSYATQIKDQSREQIDISELAKLTGVRYSSTQLAFPKENFPFDAPIPADPDAWILKAKENNHNLMAARLTAEAYKQNVTEAVGNQLPQVDFVGTYGYVHTDARGGALSNVFAGKNFAHVWTVAVQATWSIFGGGALFSTTEQAVKTYESQTETSLQLERNIMASTKQDYLAVISDVAQVQALKQAVISDEFALKQLQEEYKVGTQTIVNVLDQANQLFLDRKKYTRAEYQYMIDRLTLDQDVGGLNQSSLEAVNQSLTLA